MYDLPCLIEIQGPSMRLPNDPLPAKTYNS
jgi:hypothetical protein